LANSWERGCRPCPAKLLAIQQLRECYITANYAKSGSEPSTLDDFHRRGIHFRSLTEEINTDTPGGKLIFHIFAALAEFERGLSIERTRAGMKAARARGVRPGPKPKLSRQQIDHARKLIDSGQRREDVAGLFKVGRVTLYRALSL
jgi:DNA invertase Pin-like site-specific DNA recombinase